MVAANGSGPAIDLPRRNERLEELIVHGLSATCRRNFGTPSAFAEAAADK